MNRPAKLGLGLLLFVAAAAGACLAQRACGQQAAPLVMHIAWDGADYRRVSQLLTAGELPNLQSLVSNGGSFQRLEIIEASVTKPSWATQLSGLPWNVHGSRDNTLFRAIPEGWTVPEHLKAQGIPSGWVSGKCRNQRQQLCSGVDGASGQEFPFKRVKSAVIYHVADAELSKQQITSRCVEAISAVNDARGAKPGYVFCHYQWPDFTGHKQGGDSAAYDQDLRDLDAELAALLASLPPASVVLLSSDHGFEQAGDPNESYPFDPRWPARRASKSFGFSHLRSPNAILAASIPLLSPATGRDIAKTLYTLLGIDPPEPLPEGRSLVP